MSTQAGAEQRWYLSRYDDAASITYGDPGQRRASDLQEWTGNAWEYIAEGLVALLNEREHRPRAVIGAEIARLEALRAGYESGTELYSSLGLVLAGLHRALLLLGGGRALEGEMQDRIEELDAAPIAEGGTHGFAFDDLRWAMPPEQWDRFNRWMDGQTTVIIQGRACAFTRDVGRFLAWERRQGGTGRPLPPVFD